MKKFFILFILFTAICFSAGAMETGGSFTIGNNNLPDEAMTDTAFSGEDYLWGMSAFWNRAANDTTGIEVGFYRDSILKNIGYTNFYYNDDLFNIEVGPFFGLFNTTENLMKSGISTSVRLNFPGIAFAQLQTQSTIGSMPLAAGDYTQESNSIAAGFYVYNAICTLQLSTKSFSEINDDGYAQALDFTEYAFITDIFQKNVPYTITLKLAYQNRARTIESTSVETLNNLVLGTDIHISPFEFLSLTFGLESGLYSFGSLEDLAASSSELLTFSEELPGSYLFNATIGATLNLDNINN